MLIKTTDRSKIPKNFSYPIGAEILSNAFKNLKQYDELGIEFQTGTGDGILKFNKTIKQKGEIPIFIIYFSNLKPGHGVRWRITVYAVPRDSKHTIKILFLNDILIKARNWLEALEKKLPLEHGFFYVFFDLMTEKYRIEEGSSRYNADYKIMREKFYGNRE